MNKQQSFEQQVTSWMAAEVTKPPEWLLDHILASTAGQRPLPRWLALLKERPMRSNSQIIAGSPARRLVFITILIVLLGAAVAGIGALLLSNPGPDDWPGFRGGVDRTGAGLTGPVGNPVLDWRFSAQGAISGSAAITGDSVFVTSDDGVLHALAIGDAREIWTYRSANGPLSGPLAIDGRVYVSSQGCRSDPRPGSEDGKPPLDGVHLVYSRLRTHGGRWPRLSRNGYGNDGGDQRGHRLRAVAEGDHLGWVGPGPPCICRWDHLCRR